jgi:hypothetical protein
MKEDKEDSSDEKPSIPKELQTWKKKVRTRNLTDLNGLAECRHSDKETSGRSQMALAELGN